ncbi:hypothetical protein PQX77_004898 [Marasmius sp. AFHP31]|nr:hypothetical protein PQX77_004898 [Marasmius sp. AFHP31]
MVNPTTSTTPAVVVGVVALVIAILSALVGLVIGIRRCNREKRTRRTREVLEGQRKDLESGLGRDGGWSRPLPSTGSYVKDVEKGAEMEESVNGGRPISFVPATAIRSIPNFPGNDTDSAVQTSTKPASHIRNPSLSRQLPHLAIPSNPKVNRKSTRRKAPGSPTSRRHTLSRLPTISRSCPSSPIGEHDAMSPGSPYSLYSLPTPRTPGTPDFPGFQFSPVPSSAVFDPTQSPPLSPVRPNPNANLNRATTRVISNIFRTRAASVGFLGGGDEETVEHIERSGSIVNYSGKGTQKWKRGVDRHMGPMQTLEENEEVTEASEGHGNRNVRT